MRTAFVNDIVAPGTRVVVIPVGVARYAEPSPAQQARGRSRLDDLDAVERDLERLAALFATEPYRRQGFAVLPRIAGRAGEVGDRLTTIADELSAEPNRTVLLLWAGHGETPAGGDLRLATADSLHPMTSADGLSPAELVNKLAASGARSLCLVIDVCQAGAALAPLAATAAQRFRENPDARYSGLAAVFSAQAYESAEDGVFAAVLERVLREGPSPQARARIAERGWGGFTHNRLLTMSELQDVLEVEFEVMQETRPVVQAPVGLSFGRSFGVFPNPLYRTDAPPLAVDVARRRWLRQQDFEAHFLPKARGLEPGEEGWAFSGREDVSRAIARWLQGQGEDAERPVYVVTGSGGTGKSAVLGRMVALSDASFRAANPAAAAAADTAPAEDSFSAALHLRNLDLPAAANALSELLGVAPPTTDDVDAWVEAQPLRLPGEARDVTVALDALDEATEPVALVDRLIRPLAQRGWRFLIGSRRAAAARGASRLLERLENARVRDLDAEAATHDDIERYVASRLLHSAGSPYAGRSVQVAAIARGIADRAEGVFLFARLAVSGLLHRPPVAAGELDEVLGRSVGDVLARDVESIDTSFRARFDRKDAGASALLGALAWAHGDGLPVRDGVWALVAGAVSPDAPAYADEHVQWVLREAGRYVVESGDGEQAVYRLFHESLNEHFRARGDADETGLRIAAALQRDVVEHGGWETANPYAVRHLPSYYRGPQAALERLCTDPQYLRRALAVLGVDWLAELMAAAYRRHRSSAIEAVAKSLRRARVALSQEPEQLAAQLHARLADEHWGSILLLLRMLPRVAPAFWLRSRGATLGWRAQLQTMQTFGAKVRALAFGTVDGESVIAVGAGTSVVLWNPRMGRLPRELDNDGLRVTGLALGELDGQPVVVVGAGYDGRLVVRDARTGRAIGDALACSAGPVAIGRLNDHDVVVVRDVDGFVARPLVAGSEPDVEVAEPLGSIGGALVGLLPDGGVQSTVLRVARLDTREPVGVPVSCPEGVRALAAGEVGGAPVLAVATSDGVLRLHDLRSGSTIGADVHMDFPVRTLVVGEIDGECIVAAGNDSDDEAGYVAIRQPAVIEREAMPLDADLAGRRVLGVGRVEGRARGIDDLVLLFEGVGAVEPSAWEIVARRPGDGRRVEVVSGAWAVPAVHAPAPERIPGAHGAGRGFVLHRDRPLHFPVLCEAWAQIGGRLLQARAGFLGAAWVVDAATGDIVGGPFREVPASVRIWTGVKKAPDAQDPATGVAMGTWDGVGVVAIAHRGRAEVFELASGRSLGSPDTGRSEIRVVALGEAHGRGVLVTGSAGGAVRVWEAPMLRRLAGITLDGTVRDVWIARDLLAVRTGDDRVHVFDLVTGRHGAVGYAARGGRVSDDP